MSLLKPRSTPPCKDIDVHFQPFVDELKELWHGFESYDVPSKLHVSITCYIYFDD